MKALTRILFLATCFVSLPAPVLAQSEPRYVEGVHYAELAEHMPTVDPAQIEVLELFWYGCPHCFDFDPLLSSWAETLPEETVLARKPAAWATVMVNHLNIFYTAKELGILEQIHTLIFEEMHSKKNPLDTEDKARDFFLAQGIDAERFNTAWNSEAVATARKDSRDILRNYQAKGVPTIVVNGKYVILNAEVKSLEDMLDIADFLVKKEIADQVKE